LQFPKASILSRTGSAIHKDAHTQSHTHRERES